MEKAEIRQILIDIKKNNYKVPNGIDAFEFSVRLLDFIGDVDAEMREELAYYVLVNWILEDVLSVEEAKKLNQIILEEGYLTDGIGQVDDRVFKRSYSILMSGCIVFKHSDSFNDEEVKYIFNRVLDAFQREVDIRGFIEEKCFAHSAAHGADAFLDLVQYSVIDETDLMNVLNAIRDKISIDHYGYYHFEDERMISVIERILNRKVLTEDQIIGWLDSFNRPQPPKVYKGVPYQAYMLEVHNIVMFLKTLYFRLHGEKDYEYLLPVIMKMLKEISLFGEGY